MKKFLAMALALCMIFALCASSLEASAEEKVIHLGGLAPLTGNYAEYGKGFKYSWEKTIQEINDAGGVNGYTFAIEVKDSQGDPVVSSTLATEFAEDDEIYAILGDFTSSCCLANTAPCIAYATYRIKSRCSQANIVVTPADHLVTNELEFQRIIRMGFDFVSQPAHSDALLTIGINPSRPETGYGYIEVPQSVIAQGKESRVVEVANFKEKPDLERAKEFLAAGNYFWNSGIFIWSLEGILNAFRNFLPDMVKIFDSGSTKFGTPDEQGFINEKFAECENISIDYGVMERSQSRYTIPADFGWSDIGTWGSFYTHAQHDLSGNALLGNIVINECQNSVVNVEEGTEAIVQGLDNCLVAYRDHSLLVCRLQDEQRIKNWVEELDKRK